MAEYIDRKAAIEALVGLTIYSNAPSLNAAVEQEYHNGREWIGGVRDALIEIGDLSAADVKPVKRGKWIPVTNGRGGHECSECHDYAPSYQVGMEYLANYCPNCGADMREPKQNVLECECDTCRIPETGTCRHA